MLERSAVEPLRIGGIATHGRAGRQIARHDLDACMFDCRACDFEPEKSFFAEARQCEAAVGAGRSLERFVRWAAGDSAEPKECPGVAAFGEERVETLAGRPTDILDTDARAGDRAALDIQNPPADWHVSGE